jgi:hypothetical protein
VKRLIAEEKARLSEEKRLPTSASELVRGLVATWSTAASPAALQEKDGWLARRMDDVHASLKDGALSTIELNELDDALDPLERLTVGYTGTAAALARLRIALGEARPAATPLASWNEIQALGLAHLGVKLDLPALRSELERVRSALHDEISLENKLVSAPDLQAVQAKAEPLVLVEGTCGGGQGVRSLGPSPERAPICGLLRALAQPGGSGASMLRAIHDDATLALWALAIHGDKLDAKRAAEKYRLESGIPFEREVRLLRRAVVRPVSVLGAGWATTLLYRENKLDTDVAARWLAFGDAPLDVIASELVTPASARTPPASPRP